MYLNDAIKLVLEEHGYSQMSIVDVAKVINEKNLCPVQKELQSAAKDVGWEAVNDAVKGDISQFDVIVKLK